MKKIKTFVVTTERITDRHQGAVDYGIYLINPKHPNHKSKTTIIPMFGDINEFIANTITSCNEVDMANTKGGRPVQSYMQSFVLNLPPIYQPTDEQWKKVGGEVALAICKHLELDPKKFRKYCFTNLHKQKNSHFNVCFSRAFEGKVLEKLDQKSTLQLVKNTFTAAVLKHCGIDVANYEVVNPTQPHLDGQGEPYPTKRVRKWQIPFNNLVQSLEAWISACKAKNEEEKLKAEERFLDSEDYLIKSVHSKRVLDKISEMRKTAEETTQQQLPIRRNKM